jgi:hypothetical protein
MVALCLSFVPHADALRFGLDAGVSSLLAHGWPMLLQLF